MEKNDILSRASKLAKYNNVSIELEEFKYKASLIIKNMGDNFVVKYSESTNRAVINPDGFTKEKDFLYALMESTDVLIYEKEMSSEDINGKNVVIYNDALEFEKRKYSFSKNCMTLFILVTNDEDISCYYPSIKFEESKVYGKKFYCDLTKSL